MNKAALAQKTHGNAVDSYKIWLRDNTPIHVVQGLYRILSKNNSDDVWWWQMQINHLKSKLLGKMMFAGISVVKGDGFIVIDDVITIKPNLHDLDMLNQYVVSRPEFVKVIYQYMTCFPDALYEAYREVTGANLILDDLSEVRAFYEHCSAFDSWTGHQLCAYISHCDPNALDILAEDSEDDDPPDMNPTRYLPEKLSRIFSRNDLYENNAPIVKAAILGGAFELIHLDRNNWEQSLLKPKKGLEWAKKKGIDYHHVLDECVLPLERTPAISSGYTTPYLEMMQAVIKEMDISRENQGKKEALATLFAKKLSEHTATPPSQKLADAMATLVRLPESQQGRAKLKG